MSEQLFFGDLTFEADFVFALTSSGDSIKFSKHERALLNYFISRPEKLLTRDMLLDCIQHVASDTLDRNIDYLVSRLRRKLGDSAKNPRYIATQYGEGYLWIAGERHAAVDHPGAIYLSVGPVYGLSQASAVAAYTTTFVDDLLQALKISLGSQGLIEILPQDVKKQQAHHQANYALELSFITSIGKVTCNVVIVNRQTGQVFGSFRHKLDNAVTDNPNSMVFTDLATRIKNSIWQAQIFRADEQPTISTDPLSVGMHKAAQLFEPGKENLPLVERKLRQHLAASPNDARSAILLATNINSQLYAGDFDNLEEKNKEIERLVFDNLDSLQNDALYLSSMAERLFDLGHCELGETLAERALDLGPSFAACYMVVGRIHVLNGNIYEGLGYYEHSLEMSEPNSVFYQLLQTMKSIAYKALGEYEQVRELAAYLIEYEPNPLNKMVKHALLLAGDKQGLPLHVRAMLRMIPAKSATHYLKILYYIAARNLKYQHHRENILRGMVEHMVRLHGKSVVPEWIRQSTPSLLK